MVLNVSIYSFRFIFEIHFITLSTSIKDLDEIPVAKSTTLIAYRLCDPSWEDSIYVWISHTKPIQCASFCK